MQPTRSRRAALAVGSSTLLAGLVLAGARLGSRPSAPTAPLVPFRVLRSSDTCGARNEPAAKGRSRLQAAFAKLPLRFEANRGQADANVRFLAHGNGYSLSLAPTETILSLSRPAPKSETAEAADRRRGPERARAARPRRQVPAKPAPPAVLHMRLAGASPRAKLIGQEKLPGIVNYFRGRDPNGWRTHVPTYARVRYEQVYPGVDLVYYGKEHELEYDFVVSPGTDPRRIALSFSGADTMQLDSRGDLVLHTAAGAVRQHKPVLYQEMRGVRRPVSGGYVLKGKQQVGFAVAKYDATRPLIIDPVLSYATYLDASGRDSANAIAADAAGNVYVTGETYYWGDKDIFVAKLDPTGSQLLYYVTIGDNDEDAGNGIAVDGDGNAYVTGVYSRPSTFGYNPYLYIGKLSPAGELMYSTIYTPSSGMADHGKGNSIVVDGAGNACVVGEAYPVEDQFPRGFLTGDRGSPHAIVLVIDPTGASIVYGAFLGGTGLLTQDSGNAIAVDGQGCLYVTGFTRGGGFPTTPGAFQERYSGDIDGDAFVAKIDPRQDGIASLIYSTYLGGNDFDEGRGIAVDSAGNAYVAGATKSTWLGVPFPTTPGAFQTDWGGGNCSNTEGRIDPCMDGFVTKLSADGSSLVYSSYLGGLGIDWCNTIAVDADGYAYVTGLAGSFFPSVNAFQAYGGGIEDAFVAKVSPDGSTLAYSSPLGGGDADYGNGIALDGSGNVYIAGYTRSSDFPTTPGAYQGAYRGGSSSGFVAKIAP